MAGKPQKHPDTLAGHNADRAQLVALDGHRREPPPLPPGRWLKSSRQLWDSVWRSDVATAWERKGETALVARWLLHNEQLTRAYAGFRKAPTVEGSTGQPRLNPLWTTIKDLEAMIAKLDEKLALTPWDRVRFGFKGARMAKTIDEINRAMEEAPVVETETTIDAEWSPL